MSTSIAIDELLSDSRTVHDFVSKVLVVGDVGAGKTALVQRAVYNRFTENLKSTIGVDFALKRIRQKPNVIVNLQLWDIAGQERFGNLTRAYYKGADVAFLVIDGSKHNIASTFVVAEKWKHDIDTKIIRADGSPLPVVLLVNKVDAVEKEGRLLDEALINDFCAKNNFVAWLPTSAKTGYNVEKAMRCVVECLRIRVYDETNDDSSDKIDLSKPVPRTWSSYCCSS